MANRLMLDKITNAVELKNIPEKVILESSLRISDDSAIRRAVVGNNSKTKNASIGSYTNMGDNCRAGNTFLENSIVMNRSNMESESAIMDSIIGSELAFLSGNSVQSGGN